MHSTGCAAFKGQGESTLLKSRCGLVLVLWLFGFNFRADELKLNLQDVCAVINVQHNCHSSNCTMQWTRTVHFERQDNESKAAEFKHGDDDNYLVNGAALSSVGWQRQFSAVPCVRQSNQGQLRALHQGIARWHAQETPSGPSGAFEAVDPTLA